ncbi:hypothetical protein BUALT_Bualt17G0089000 [Buddleja alternifolia]|uniref:Uncharacterized protein n=1 Tax=Buddleja alternifolia TaxID=168488 RepID=A0AAV6WHQ4_9LAMI|nr:hypothetical protein BUALT_Bualt17G0089000 [Buddleja alternifolia]
MGLSSSSILLPIPLWDLITRIFNVACYQDIADDLGEDAECAVCLCKIDGDDEVKELRSATSSGGAPPRIDRHQLLGHPL